MATSFSCCPDLTCLKYISIAALSILSFKYTVSPLGADLPLSFAHIPGAGDPDLPIIYPHRPVVYVHQNSFEEELKEYNDY